MGKFKLVKDISQERGGSSKNSQFSTEMLNAILRTFYAPVHYDDWKKANLFNLINTIKELRWCLENNCKPTPMRLIQAIVSSKYLFCEEEVYKSLYDLDRCYISAHSLSEEDTSETLAQKKMMVKICPFVVEEEDKVLGKYRVVFTENPLEVFHCNLKKWKGSNWEDVPANGALFIGVKQASAFGKNNSTSPCSGGWKVKYSAEDIIELLDLYISIYNKEKNSEFSGDCIFDFSLGGVCVINGKEYLVGRVEFSPLSWFEKYKALNNAVYEDLVNLASALSPDFRLNETERRRRFLWTTGYWMDFYFYVYIGLPLDDLKELFLQNQKGMPLPIGVSLKVENNSIRVNKIRILYLDLPQKSSIKVSSFKVVSSEKIPELSPKDMIEEYEMKPKLNDEQTIYSIFRGLDVLSSAVNRGLPEAKEFYFDLFYKGVCVYRWIAKSWKDVLTHLKLLAPEIDVNKAIYPPSVKYTFDVNVNGVVYPYVFISTVYCDELNYYLAASHWVKSRSKNENEKYVLQRLFVWLTKSGDAICLDYNLPPLFEKWFDKEEQMAFKQFYEWLDFDYTRRRKQYLNFDDMMIVYKYYQFFSPLRYEVLYEGRDKEIGKSKFLHMKGELNGFWKELGDVNVKLKQFIINNSLAGLTVSAKKKSPLKWYLSYKYHTTAPLFKFSTKDGKTVISATYKKLTSMSSF